MSNEEKIKPAKKSNMIKIDKPLKDHTIVQNEFKYEIKKGESIEVDARFKQVLKTEGVIK